MNRGVHINAVRRLAVMCLVCVLAGLVLSSSSVVPAAAGSALPTTRFHRRPPHKKGKSNLSRRQEVKSRLGSTGVPASPGGSLFGDPLVVVGSLVESEESSAQEWVSLSSPEVVVAREGSQTKYEGLSSEAAERVDGEAFPGVVDEPAGGPPELPAGESIVGFPADNAAQVDLPGGGHGVIESLGVMAVEAAPGQRVPMDLSLVEAGGVFEPRTPSVGVRIPKELQGGWILGRLVCGYAGNYRWSACWWGREAGRICGVLWWGGCR